MTQLTSQNGWPAYGRGDAGYLYRFTAADRQWWAANRDVVLIATVLIARFNAEVETLDGPVLDDWSWNPDLRPIRGEGPTGEYSNHDSATAWDLNALKHPRGKRGTFSFGQEVAIREILAYLVDEHGHQVIRWGGDYKHAPVDEMHFELITDRAGAQSAARKLTVHATTPPKETDMQPGDLHELTASEAAAYNAADPSLGWTAGHKIPWSYVLLWGGPGLARLSARVAELERLFGGAQLAATGAVHQVSGVAGIASSTADRR
jgi:hypothetical protein